MEDNIKQKLMNQQWLTSPRKGLFKTACVFIAFGAIGFVGMTFFLTFSSTVAHAQCPWAEVQNATKEREASILILTPKHPHWIEPDEPLDDVMRRNAKHAIDSGLWEAQLKAQQQSLIKWAEEPAFPLVRPMATTSYMTVKPTGITQDRFNKAFPKGIFENLARWYVLFDERNDAQRRFVKALLRSDSVMAMPGAIRPVVTGGSVKRAMTLLDTRVWADQGSVLTRRLGVTHWPAVVKLTPSDIVTWVPALDVEGVPLDAMPTELGLSK